MPKAAPKHRVKYPAARRHCPPTPSRQARRALATNSAAWLALRQQVLNREPLCRCCAARGVIRAATDVDHIDGDASNNDDANLQPLCRRCHSRKTAREDGGFGNRKKR